MAVNPITEKSPSFGSISRQDQTHKPVPPHIKELIDRAEKALRTNLTNNIVIKEVASPLTLRDLSLNYKGAIRGWGLDYKQMDLKKVIAQVIKVKGLYSVGHWSVTLLPILEGGVSMVAHGGKHLAKKILLEIKSDD